MIHLVPIIPISKPLTGPVDLLSTIPVLIVALGIPLVFRFGLMLVGYIIQRVEKAFVALPDDKPKREQPVSFFEPPTEEPDYVVGFGDDGELIYASEEKPKRKNDELPT